MKTHSLLPALLALLLLTVTPESTAQKRFGKTLRDTPGLVSYSLRHDFARDMPGTFDKIKAMGITNMEMSNLFGKTAADVRGYLDARGMRCTSYGVSYDALTQRTDGVVADARTLGAEFVRLGSFPHQGTFDQAQADAIAATFNRLGKTLRAAGLTFVYHNHGFEFQPWKDGPTGLTYYDYLLQHTNPEDVAYELDLLWVVYPGHDPAALLRRYPDRFRLMHVKDLKKGVRGDFSGGTSPENDVTLGTGQVDLPAVLRAARRSAIKYYYIEDENPAAEQQIPQSLAYLRGL
jgi:sugar phosphate isomerase/epimerase